MLVGLQSEYVCVKMEGRMARLEGVFCCSPSKISTEQLETSSLKDIKHLYLGREVSKSDELASSSL